MSKRSDKNARRLARKARHLARKDRQQATQVAQATHRLVRDVATEQVERVRRGEARIMLAYLADELPMVAAMWQPDGDVAVHLAEVSEEGFLALSKKALEHVSADEWLAFVDEHHDRIQASPPGVSVLSGIAWRPGEMEAAQRQAADPAAMAVRVQPLHTDAIAEGRSACAEATSGFPTWKSRSGRPPASNRWKRCDRLNAVASIATLAVGGGMAHFSAQYQVHSPRWGHADTYHLSFSDTGIELGQDLKRVQYVAIDGAWKGHRGGSPVDLFADAGAHPPAITPFALEYAWKQWLNGTPEAQVREALQELFGWIDVVARSKPRGGLWQAAF